MKLSEKLPEIMALAQRAADYWEFDYPKTKKNYPFLEEGEEEGPPPPQQEQIRRLLETLPDEQLYALQAVVEMGARGLRVEQLPKHHKELPRDWKPKSLAANLAGRTMLVYDLEDGLEKLGKKGLDIDSLPLSAVPA